MFMTTVMAVTCSTSNTFLGLVPWYKYLKLQDDGAGGCTVSMSSVNNIWSEAVLPIGLAVVDDMLRIAAMVSLGYIIFGGIKYMTSQGSSDGVQEALNTIKNAVIGLVIALFAVSIVNFIGRQLG